MRNCLHIDTQRVGGLIPIRGYVVSADFPGDRTEVVPASELANRGDLRGRTMQMVTVGFRDGKKSKCQECGKEWLWMW